MWFQLCYLCPTNDIFSIPGYNFVSKFRKHKPGGGVGIFIKSSFEYKRRPDLQLQLQLYYTSEFNDFFINTGHSLSKRFSRSHNQHRQYLAGSYNESILLLPTSH